MPRGHLCRHFAPQLRAWLLQRLALGSYPAPTRAKEIAKGRKIFFWDTGIRNALLNAFSADALRPDIGALWENWAIAEVAKRNALLGAPFELYFWRSRAQSEVDLVIRQDERLRAFELKWSSRRGAGRAFRDAYGVTVETLAPENPFVADLLDG
jgi:predicted AAA+ superfamily ATPase